MNKIRVTSECQFSGCKTVKELELPKEKIAAIEGAMLSGTVFNQSVNNIAYEWVITEVELLN